MSTQDDIEEIIYTNIYQIYSLHILFRIFIIKNTNDYWFQQKVGCRQKYPLMWLVG